MGCCFRRQREHPAVVFSSQASANLREAVSRCTLIHQELELGCISACDTLALLPTAQPQRTTQVDREEIHGLPDGGVVAVDWIGDKRAHDPSLVVLMFPGTGTTSKSGFTAMIAHYMAERPELFSPEEPAFGVAVMQGFDGLPLMTTKLIGTPYVSLDDAGAIIEHVTAKFPKAAIVVVGVSVGGAFLTHWAGTNPQSCKNSNIVAGIIIAHGLDIYKSRKACEPALINNFLMSKWRETLRRSPPKLDVLASAAPDFDIASLDQARTIEEWDHAILPLYGFADEESMLRASDTGPLLQHVQIPLVFLSADNDPVAPATRLIDEGRIHELVSNCAAIRTENGSHLSWWQGSLRNLQQPWICNVMSELVIQLAAMSKKDLEQI